MRILALLVLLLVVGVGLTFSVMNAEPVTLDYYFGSSDIPLALLLVISLALGALLGVIASLGLIVRLKRTASSLRRENRLAEKEIMNLRNIPIRDRH